MNPLQEKWDYLHEIYPINKELIWMNNCGITPVNQKTIYEIQTYLNDFAKHCVLTEVNTYEETKKSIKSILSKLLSCSENELCIIHNTNEGFNFISHGLEFEYGDEIIVLENEYPSNVYPWEHWTEKNIKLSTVKIGNHPRDFISNLLNVITNKTKLISLSPVHWCNGMPLPLEEVGKICESNSILFALDGAQGIGHVPINLKACNVSFASFPAWKWLLGPLGLGVLYITESKLEKLKFPFKGTSSVINDQEYLPYKDKLKPTTDRYEISTCNFLDWVYFESTLKILDNIGFENVMKRIYELSISLQNALEKKGYEVDAKKFSDVKTGIVTFKKNGISTENLYQILKNNKVICPIRLDKIRLSPHVYNSFEQLEQIISFLP